MRDTFSLIWVIAAVGVAAAIISGIAHMKIRKIDDIKAPPREADAACHMDLAALGRTLPYVPMSFHERMAAHRILRQAYAETDDERCRQLGGYILQRFYARNLHGESL